MKEYTIKEVSELLGVSVQTVYRKINEFNIKPIKSGKIKTITEDDLNFIKNSKIDNNTKINNEPQSKKLEEKETKSNLKESLSTKHEPKNNSLTSEIVELLNKELLNKNAQLDVKDKQIENLQNLLNQSQQLQALANKKALMLEEKAAEDIRKSKKKKRFWEFWK